MQLKGGPTHYLVSKTLVKKKVLIDLQVFKNLIQLFID